MSVKLVKFKQELKNQLKLKMAYKDRAFYKGSWLWRKELRHMKIHALAGVHNQVQVEPQQVQHTTA